MRETVREEAAAAGLPRARVAEVVLAVHEVAMNAVVHGEGEGAVRVWEEEDELLCEVEDHGSGIPDPLAGTVPPEASHPRGRGLWIARQLCDRVEIESEPGETRVRLHVRLSRRLVGAEGRRTGPPRFDL